VHREHARLPRLTAAKKELPLMIMAYYYKYISLSSLDL